MALIDWFRSKKELIAHIEKLETRLNIQKQAFENAAMERDAFRQVAEQYAAKLDIERKANREREDLILNRFLTKQNSFAVPTHREIERELVKEEITPEQAEIKEIETRAKQTAFEEQIDQKTDELMAFYASQGRTVPREQVRAAVVAEADYYLNDDAVEFSNQ